MNFIKKIFIRFNMLIIISAFLSGCGDVDVEVENLELSRLSYTTTNTNLAVGQFPNTLITTTNDVIVTVSNSGEADAQNLAITLSGDSEISFTGGSFPGTGGTCGLILVSGTSCTLAFTFTPGAVNGNFSSNLNVVYNDDFANRDEDVAIFGRGVLPANLDFDITNHDFGQVAFDAAIPASGVETLSLTLTNIGEFEAASVLFSNPSSPYTILANNCPTVLGEAQSCQITVEFRPTAVASFNYSALGPAPFDQYALEVDYNDGFAASGVTNQTRISEFSGQGVLPALVQLTALPDLFDFGQAVITTSDTHLFTATNTGSLNAVINQSLTNNLTTPFIFEGSNTFPGLSGTCNSIDIFGNLIIAPGESCLIAVNFTPTAAGAFSDNVEIHYENGISTVVETQTIQGEGLLPAVLEISDNPLFDFGTTRPNQATFGTLTVQNTGGATATSVDDITLAAPFDYQGGFPGTDGTTAGTCTSSLAAGSSCTIVARFLPLSFGTFNDDIQVDYFNGLSVINTQRSVTGIADRPTVSVTSPIAGDFINLTNENSFPLSGICSDNGEVVNITVGATVSPTTCLAGAWTLNINVSAAADSTSFNILVDHIDAFGNMAIQASVTVIKDTTPPTIAIVTAPVINLANVLAYTFSGTCSEDGEVVNVDVGGVTETPTCSSGTWTTTVDVTGIIDGTVNITADHTDAAGNVAVQATASVDKDTVVPDLEVTIFPVINIVNASTYTLSGTCSENGEPVIVNVGGVANAPLCTAGVWSATVDVSALADGTLTITADHIDAAGNSAAQASMSVVKDTIAATVALTSSPVINLANVTAYPLSGTCSEDGEVVSIDVGGVLDTPTCSSGVWNSVVDVSGVADGTVALTVDHVDAAGNPAVQISINVDKDTVLPVVAITISPDIIIANQLAYTVSGTCSDDTELVVLDVGGLTDSPVCVSGAWSATIDTSSLVDGAVTITADHSDAAGNPATQAIVSITKDTTPPLVAITSNPVINLANVSSYNFSGTCSEDTLIVNVDVGGVTDSPICTSGAWTSTLDVSSIVDGAVTITADHTDVFGNSAVQASVSVIKDTVLPLITITSNPDINLANVTAYTISGTCSEDTITVSVDVAGVIDSPVCTSGAWTSTLDVSSVVDGAVTITADHNDAAGNPAVQISISVTKDTIPPLVAITSNSVINLANVSTYTVSGTCSEDTQIVSVDVGGVTDIPVCASGAWSSTLDVSSVADGAVTITADHDDALGNPALQVTVSVIKDTVIPTVAVTTFPNINLANVASYTFSGACSEDTQDVSLSVGGVTDTRSCTTGTWTSTIDTTSLADGTVTITADHIDLAGNSALQVSLNVIKDTVIPLIAITVSPDITLSNFTSYTVSGTCSEDTENVSLDIGGLVENPTCISGAWSATVDTTTLADGSVAITADHIDALGNPAVQASVSVIKDTTPPLVAITVNPNIALANVGTYTVSGTCSEDTQIVSIDIGGVTDSPVCTAGVWATTLDTTTVVDGPVTITADHIDTLGNAAVQASVSIIKDTIIPLVAITSSPDIALANVGAYTISGTCSEDTIAVNIDVGGVTDAPVCTSGSWTSILDVTTAADGTVAITVDQADALGNSAVQASVSVIKDTIIPTVAITSSPDISLANVGAYIVSGTCSEDTIIVNVDVGGVADAPVCTSGAWIATVDVTSIADGPVVITADHDDALGNSAVQTSISVVKDTVIPTVVITNSPDIALANVAAYTVSGTCSEDGQVVNIDISGVVDTPTCTSGNWITTIDATSITDGTVAITADHLDAVGNSAVQGTASVIKDTVIPLVAITSSPDISLANETAYIISGTCSEDTIAVNVDIGGVTDAPVCSTGVWSSTLDVSSLIDGTVTITLDHDDALGNSAVQASVDIIKDTTPPTVAITNNLDINLANVTTYIVSGTCSDDTQIVNIDVGGVTGAPVCTSGTWSSTLDVTSVTDGPVVITADHDDVFGNSAVQASVSVTKDTVIPTVAITSSPDISLANVGAYIVSGTCSEDTITVNIDISGVADAPVCTSGAWTTTVDVTSIADGPVVITADHDDAVGNSAVQTTASINKDTTPPTVAITISPNISLANVASYVLSGTCSEDTIAVNVDVGGVTDTPICLIGAWSSTVDVTSIADGSVVITVDHNDVVGNSAIQATVSLIKDTVVPTITITGPVDIALANLTTYTVNGTCSEDTIAVNIDVGGVTDAPVCTSGAWSSTLDITSVADGLVTITADHDDAVGNSAAQATASVTKDTVVPTIAITSSPDINLANVASYVLSGTCSEDTITVNVDVGGVTDTPVCLIGAWSSTLDISSVTDGAVAITADHDDALGNSAVQATASVTKDTVVPTIAIISSPDINLANVASYVLSGTCSEDTIAVNIDVGGVTDAPTCTSGTWSSTLDVSSLADGAVAITADHNDALGNSAVQATASVTKDTVVPTIAITSSPDINLTNQAAYIISGTCSEDTLEVNIDIGGVTDAPVCSSGAWSSTLDVSTVADGAVVITADHDDALGNLAVQATASINKDTTPPIVVITASPNIALSNVTAYTISGTCSEDTLAVNIDVGGVTDIPVCTSGAWSSTLDVSSVADGTVAIIADHDDALGNSAVQATASVTKDTIVPLVAITSSPDINLANVASYVLSGTCSEDTLAVNIDVGGVTDAPVCTSGAWNSTLDVSSLTDGAVVITADHDDALGNSAVQASASVTKDTVVPTIAITSSSDISLANVASYVLSGTCSEDTISVNVDVGGITDTPVCTSGAWSSTLDVSSLTDGAVAITADHVDALGNSAVQATASVTKDTVVPLVAITNSPDISLANQAAYIISGTCSEDIIAVNIDVGGVTDTPVCLIGGWTSTLDVSGLTEGAVAITADHDDALGNSALQATASVTKDTVVPLVAITSSPDISLANQAAYIINGTCSEDTLAVNIDVGGITDAPVCISGAWSSTLDVSSIADGAVAITADHVDALGNSGVQATASINKDTTPPTVTIISSPDINLANVASYVLSGTCSEDTLAVNIDIGGVTDAPVCSSGTWSSTLDVSSLTDGAIAITADHDDALGNAAVQATASVTKDTVVPTIAITSSPDISLANVASYVLSGTCSEDTISVNIDVGGVTDAPVCTSGSWSSTLDVSSVVDGAVAITADHDDALGNSAVQATASVTKDTIVPLVAITSSLDINLVNVASYVLAGTCSEDTISVNVDVGGVTDTPVCTSGAWSSTLDVSSVADGAVAITADHVDALGNSAVQASASVTKDTIVPLVAITSSPDISLANVSAYIVSGTCSEDTITVNLDVGGITDAPVCSSGAWSSTLDVSSLADGAVAITADHVDALGNSAVQATASVTKDTVVPLVAITSSPDISLANVASYVLAGTCSEDTISVNIDVGGVTDTPVCTSGSWSSTLDVTSVADGAVAITADHVDTLGNSAVQASASVTKDTVVPTVAITSSTDISLANVTSYVLSGTCSEDTISVNVDVGGITDTPVCISGAWSSTLDVSSVADGAVAVTADHDDVLGNSAVQATASITKDTVVPLVAITSSLDVSLANVASYVLSGTCSEDTLVVNVDIDGVIGSPVCTSGAWTTTLDVTSVSDGTIAITADHTDALGNSAVQATISVAKDTTPSLVAIISSPDINLANVTSYIISGTCSDDTQIVSVDVGGVASSPVCTSGAWTSTIDVSSVVDGVVAITADHSDSFGNPAVQATTSVTKDTIVPLVAITSSSDISLANQVAYIISGTCSEDTIAVNIDVGGVTDAPVCSSGTWSSTLDVTSVADGAVAITADHDDALGNSAVQATASVTKDTIVPLVAITSSPDISLANVASYVLSGTCSEDTLAVNIDVGGVADAPVCISGAWSSTLDVSSVADGAVAITADHNDALGNSAVQASTSVTKDTVVPTIAITSSPDISLANQVAYIISGTCSEDTLAVNIDIGGLTDAPVCTSGAWSSTLDVTSVADGAVAITADHNDALGNSAVQATASVTKDTVVPTVAITSSPDINLANVSAYIVSGTCSEDTLAVNVDVGGVTDTPACTSGVWSSTLDVSSLADGAIALTADHVDALGNSAVQATASVTKDTVVPLVAITSGPDINLANVVSYVLSGTCSEDTLAVSIDVGGITDAPVCSSGAWSSTLDVSGLADGAVAITADHVDALGNSAVQATASVTKDTVVPLVAITSSSDISLANQAAYIVSGTCSEDTLAVNIDIGGVTDIPVCSSGTWSSTLDVSSLTDGAVAIIADHDDALGNSAVQATVSINKDTTPPTVTIISSPDINLANVASYVLSGTCSEDTLAVSIDVGGVADAPVCTSGTWSSTLDVSALADGTVAITADHVDALGNSAVQATASVTKDTVVPLVAITSSPDISLANQAAYIVSGTCSEDTLAVNVDVGGVTDAPVCTSGAWSSTLDVSSVADGVVAITADHVDTLGNSAVQASASVTKDTVVPTIAITSSPDISLVNVAGYVLSGTCSEDTIAVNVDVGGVTDAPVCTSGAWSSTLDVSSLTDGAVAITADHVDALGNSAVQASVSVTKDTVVPTVAITSSTDINLANVSAYIVSGTCSEDTLVVNIDVGGITNTPVCTSGAWSSTLDVSSVADGAVAIIADHVDALGNSAVQATVSVTKDTVVPLVAITSSPDINLTNQAAYIISGTCSEDTIAVNIDVGGVIDAPVCTSGAWSSTLDVTSIADGAVAITADHDDALGNSAVQATASINKDTTPPTVAITSSPDISLVNVSTYIVSGTCSDDTLAVNVDVGGVTDTPVCTSGAWSSTLDVSGLTDGAVAITADHVDALGNAAVQATTSVTKDTVVPLVAITSSPDINLANVASYVLFGTCSEDTLAVNIDVGGVTDAPICTSGAWSSTLDVSSLADGAVAITADHMDALGNSAVQATASVTKGTVVPTIAITSSPDINLSNVASYALSGTCSDDALAVNIDVGGITDATVCSSGAWSSTLDVSSLADGAVAITADHMDALGNSAVQATASVTKDTVVPTIAITSSPDISLANVSAYIVSGTCSDDTLAVNIDVGGVTDAPVCTSGAWSSTLDVSSLTDGAVAITADHVDALGNSAVQATASVIKDTVVSLVAITSSPDISLANQAAYIVSGTCSEDTLAVNIDIGGVTDTPICTSGAWSSTLDVSSLADGAVAITADHDDALGNSALQATASINKDTTPPTVAITSSPDISLINVSAYIVSGTCSDDTLAVNIDVGGVIDAPVCTSGAWSSTLDVSSLADGAVIITADHDDDLGNSAVQVTTSVTKDTVVPTIAITSSPDINLVNVAIYVLSGTCSEDTLAVNIDVGGVTDAPVCSSGAWSSTLDVSSVADGAVAITADHNDALGNSAVQATASINKDTTPPTVAITSSPDISLVNQAAYIVSGTCSEDTIAVNVDVGGVTDAPVCTSGAWSSTLDVSSVADGAVAITADHDDALGNSAVQASASVTKDTIVPIVAITSSPDINLANVASYVLSGTCSEDTLAVNIDVGGVTDAPICTSGAWSSTLDISSLADGAVAITADHVDALGNSAVQASASVTKDTVVPTIVITSSPGISLANETAYTVSGTCSESGEVVNVDVGGITATDTCTLLNWTVTVDTNLISDNPAIVITADHADTFGNSATQASALVVKDTTPPTVAITSSPDIDFATAAAYIVSGTCSENTQIVSLDIGGVTATPTCTSNAWSATVDVSGVSDGVVAITVDHDDALGNSALQAVISVNKDTIVPLVAITSSSDITLSSQATYTVSGTCSEDTIVVNVDVGGVTDSPVCTSGVWSSTLDVSGVADGAVTITADHDDALGNSAVQASTSVTKDTLVPTVAITSSPSINLANVGAYIVSGTCSEDTIAVNVDVGGVTDTPVCSSGAWSSTLDISSVADGAVAIAADHMDALGNSAVQATVSVTKDTVVPTVAITSSPDISLVNVTSYILSGTCSDNVEVVNVDVGGVTDSPVCASGAWSSTLDVSSVADGAVAITADHDDALGNSAVQATASVTKDATIPLVAITSSPNINLSNETSYIISGTCSENGEVVIIDIDGVMDSPMCTAGAWSSTVDVNSVTDGTVVITLDHDDALGNSAVQATASVTKDTVVPTLTNVSILSNNADSERARTGDQITINITTSEALDGAPVVNVFGNTATVTGTGPYTATYILQATDPEGTVSFTVGFSDAVSNPGAQVSATTDTSSVEFDRTIPLVSINTAADIDFLNQTSYSVSGTCSEDAETVNINIGIMSLSPVCSSGAWSVTGIDVSSLTDGSILITADHSDLSGNAAIQATLTVIKDASAPAVSITFAPDIDLSNETAYLVSGECTENGTSVFVDVGSISLILNCSGETWDTGFLNVSSFADGAVTITADHSVATQAVATPTKDSSLELVVINGASDINSSNELNYIVSGTCTDNGVVVNVDVGGLTFSPTCSGTTWSTGFIDVSSLVDGSTSITADHSTASQASVVVNKDTVDPTVSNLTVATTLSTSANLSWASFNPSGATLNDHEINYRESGDTTWLDFDDGISLDEFATVTGLDPSTTYEFRVRLRYNTSELSLWSNTATGTTQPNDILFNSPQAVMNVGGATSSTIVAFEDNTVVTLNGVAIAASPMSAGSTVTITTAQFDVMDADKAIYVAGLRTTGGTGSTTNANIAWSPNSHAGRLFSFNATRNQDQVLSVFAIEDTTVTVTRGATVLATLTLTAGNGGRAQWGVNGSYQINSTGTILAYHFSQNGTGTTSSFLIDPKPILPSSTELIGFPSRTMRISANFDSTNYTLIHSDSTSSSGDLNQDEIPSVTGLGADNASYLGESLLISADRVISGASFADRDGNCSAPFVPTNLMRKKYAVNVVSDYVAFASTSSGTIDVYSPGQVVGVDTPVETLTLVRSGTNPLAPYRARLGATPAGYRFISTTLMAAWYQPNTNTGAGNDDETILFGTND